MDFKIMPFKWILKSFTTVQTHGGEIFLRPDVLKTKLYHKDSLHFKIHLQMLELYIFKYRKNIIYYQVDKEISDKDCFFLSFLFYFKGYTMSRKSVGFL